MPAKNPNTGDVEDAENVPDLMAALERSLGIKPPPDLVSPNGFDGRGSCTREGRSGGETDSAASSDGNSTRQSTDRDSIDNAS